jgi:hypothetical protein
MGEQLDQYAAYLLSRVDIPRGRVDPDRARAALGGQWEWNWASGMPYQAVNSPSVGMPMPARPRIDGEILDHVGYWNALQGFLLYSFGWTRHDRGIRWWLDAGAPQDDPRLALLGAVWHGDGNLVPYAAWFHDRLHNLESSPLSEWAAIDPTQDRITAVWAARLGAAVTDSPNGMSPYGTHLEQGSHSGGPAAEAFDAELSVVEAGAQRAIYISETTVGWYRGLAELSKALPPSTRSWRVQVFVKPIGFMGNFRRSRETGLWFAGRHSIHAAGQ